MLAVPVAARAVEPAAGPASPSAASSTIKVHNHVAYTLRATLDGRGPSQRAASASANLTAAIDDAIPGDVDVVFREDLAEVRLGGRLMFRISPADDEDTNAQALARDVPRIQANLQLFVDKERRRATLQNGVLRVSLAVFLAVGLWVLLRAFFRATRGFEERLLDGGAVPDRVRALGIVDVERSRGTILFALSGVRIAVSLSAVYVFLLVSLSLFPATRGARNWLALSAVAPFRALLDRLVMGLPNLLLLVVVLAVLRGGWRAMTVGFARVGSESSGTGLLRPHQVLPARLLARVALVLGGLMVLPLALGSEGGLYTVGLVLMGVVGLASLPLLANVGIGIYAMFTDRYTAGRWVRLQVAGDAVSGEVTSIDAFGLHLVPERGGEFRVPHLVALWSAVEFLPGSRGLSVEIPVPRFVRAPDALERLSQAAASAAKALSLPMPPRVDLVSLTPEHAMFRVLLPEASEAARTPLLLALEAAIPPAAIAPEPVAEAEGAVPVTPPEVLP